MLIESTFSGLFLKRESQKCLFFSKKKIPSDKIKHNLKSKVFRFLNWIVLVEISETCISSPNNLCYDNSFFLPKDNIVGLSN